MLYIIYNIYVYIYICICIHVYMYIYIYNNNNNTNNNNNNDNNNSEGRPRTGFRRGRRNLQLSRNAAVCFFLLLSLYFVLGLSYRNRLMSFSCSFLL